MTRMKTGAEFVTVTKSLSDIMQGRRRAEFKLGVLLPTAWKK